MLCVFIYLVITASVDFNMSYIEYGVTRIVPVIEIKQKHAWLFLKTLLTWNLWAKIDFSFNMKLLKLYARKTNSGNVIERLGNMGLKDRCSDSEPKLDLEDKVNFKGEGDVTSITGPLGPTGEGLFWMHTKGIKTENKAWEIIVTVAILPSL